VCSGDAELLNVFAFLHVSALFRFRRACRLHTAASAQRKSHYYESVSTKDGGQLQEKLKKSCGNMRTVKHLDAIFSFEKRAQTRASEKAFLGQRGEGGAGTDGHWLPPPFSAPASLAPFSVFTPP
jgi:hypothetical protein